VRDQRAQLTNQLTETLTPCSTDSLARPARPRGVCVSRGRAASSPEEVARLAGLAALQKLKPTAPKRKTTAFFYYCGQVRQGLRHDPEGGPDRSMPQIMTEAGQRWKALTPVSDTTTRAHGGAGARAALPPANSTLARDAPLSVDRRSVVSSARLSVERCRANPATLCVHRRTGRRSRRRRRQTRRGSSGRRHSSTLRWRSGAASERPCAPRTRQGSGRSRTTWPRSR
jgi:hypothetical protein